MRAILNVPPSKPFSECNGLTYSVIGMTSETITLSLFGRVDQEFSYVEAIIIDFQREWWLAFQNCSGKGDDSLEKLRFEHLDSYRKINKIDVVEIGCMMSKAPVCLSPKEYLEKAIDEHGEVMEPYYNEGSYSVNYDTIYAAMELYAKSHVVLINL